MATEKETDQWGMILHLSQFAGYLIPFAGFIAPIVIWQMKKEELPKVDEHGKVVANCILSMIIYSVICTVLVLLVVGVFLFWILGVIAIIFPIVGAIKALNGEVWKYPGSMAFLK